MCSAVGKFQQPGSSRYAKYNALTDRYRCQCLSPTPTPTSTTASTPSQNKLKPRQSQLSTFFANGSGGKGKGKAVQGPVPMEVEEDEVTTSIGIERPERRYAARNTSVISPIVMSECDRDGAEVECDGGVDTKAGEGESELGVCLAQFTEALAQVLVHQRKVVRKRFYTYVSRRAERNNNCTYHSQMQQRASYCHLEVVPRRRPCVLRERT